MKKSSRFRAHLACEWYFKIYPKRQPSEQEIREREWEQEWKKRCEAYLKTLGRPLGKYEYIDVDRNTQPCLMEKPIFERTWLWVSIGTFYAVLIAVAGALTSLQETMPWARSAHAYAVATFWWTLEAAFVLFALWPVSIALQGISILSRIEDYFRRHRKAQAAAVCLLAAAVVAVTNFWP
jgi:hypothetical protein